MFSADVGSLLLGGGITFAGGVLAAGVALANGVYTRKHAISVGIRTKRFEVYHAILEWTFMMGDKLDRLFDDLTAEEEDVEFEQKDYVLTASSSMLLYGSQAAYDGFYAYLNDMVFVLQDRVTLHKKIMEMPEDLRQSALDIAKESAVELRDRMSQARSDLGKVFRAETLSTSDKLMP